MKLFVSALIIFIGSLFIIEMILYSLRMFRNPHHGKIRKRLKTLSLDEMAKVDPDIMRKKVLSNNAFLHRILSRIPIMQRLDILAQQANAKRPAGYYLLLSFVLALCGLIIVTLVTRGYLISLAVAAGLGAIPFLSLHLAKKRRMLKFLAQLPDALDLVARSLRAGHAFSSGMKLAAAEFDDPLGPEFQKTIDEINFGVSVPEAMKNLTIRADCADIRYFVISVILQRETGGNLAEIIDSISYIIRERFKLYGKIQVLSKEGKMSARIITGVIFFVIIALAFLNPDYVNILVEEPAGKMIAGTAALMMLTGIIVMRKLIRIKV